MHGDLTRRLEKLAFVSPAMDPSSAGLDPQTAQAQQALGQPPTDPTTGLPIPPPAAPPGAAPPGAPADPSAPPAAAPAAPPPPPPDAIACSVADPNSQQGMECAIQAQQQQQQQAAAGQPPPAGPPGAPPAGAGPVKMAALRATMDAWGQKRATDMAPAGAAGGAGPAPMAGGAMTMAPAATPPAAPMAPMAGPALPPMPGAGMARGGGLGPVAGLPGLPKLGMAPAARPADVYYGGPAPTSPPRFRPLAAAADARTSTPPAETPSRDMAPVLGVLKQAAGEELDAAFPADPFKPGPVDLAPREFVGPPEATSPGLLGAAGRGMGALNEGIQGLGRGLGRLPGRFEAGRQALGTAKENLDLYNTAAGSPWVPGGLALGGAALGGLMARKKRKLTGALIGGGLGLGAGLLGQHLMGKYRPGFALGQLGDVGKAMMATPPPPPPPPPPKLVTAAYRVKTALRYADPHQLEPGRLAAATVGRINAIPPAVLLTPDAPIKFLTGPGRESANVVKRFARARKEDLEPLTVHRHGSPLLDDLKNIWNNPRTSPIGKGIGFMAAVPQYLGSHWGRADHYNPFSNAVTLYSGHPEVAAHEMGHALNFNQIRARDDAPWHERAGARLAHDAYATARALPFGLGRLMTLGQEGAGSLNAKKIMAETAKDPHQRDYEQGMLNARLSPAYGTYVGGSIPGIGPVLGALGGHAAAGLTNAANRPSAFFRGKHPGKRLAWRDDAGRAPRREQEEVLKRPEKKTEEPKERVTRKAAAYGEVAAGMNDARTAASKANPIANHLGTGMAAHQLDAGGGGNIGGLTAPPDLNAMARAARPPAPARVPNSSTNRIAAANVAARQANQGAMNTWRDDQITAGQRSGRNPGFTAALEAGRQYDNARATAGSNAPTPMPAGAQPPPAPAPAPTQASGAPAPMAGPAMAASGRPAPAPAPAPAPPRLGSPTAPTPLPALNTGGTMMDYINSMGARRSQLRSEGAWPGSAQANQTLTPWAPIPGYEAPFSDGTWGRGGPPSVLRQPRVPAAGAMGRLLPKQAMVKRARDPRIPAYAAPGSPDERTYQDYLARYDNWHDSAGTLARITGHGTPLPPGYSAGLGPARGAPLSSEAQQGYDATHQMQKLQPYLSLGGALGGQAVGGEVQGLLGNQLRGAISKAPLAASYAASQAPPSFRPVSTALGAAGGAGMSRLGGRAAAPSAPAAPPPPARVNPAPSRAQLLNGAGMKPMPGPAAAPAGKPTPTATVAKPPASIPLGTVAAGTQKQGRARSTHPSTLASATTYLTQLTHLVKRATPSPLVQQALQANPALVPRPAALPALRARALGAPGSPQAGPPANPALGAAGGPRLPSGPISGLAVPGAIKTSAVSGRLRKLAALKVDDTDGGQDLPQDGPPGDAETVPTGAGVDPQAPAPSGADSGGAPPGGGEDQGPPRPEDVNLRMATAAAQACAACGNFDGQACGLLQMPVQPTQTCDAFAPSPAMAGIDPGAVMAPALAAQPQAKTAGMRPFPFRGMAHGKRADYASPHGEVGNMPTVQSLGGADPMAAVPEASAPFAGAAVNGQPAPVPRPLIEAPSWLDKARTFGERAIKHVGEHPWEYGLGAGAAVLGGILANRPEPPPLTEAERRRRLAALAEAEATGKEAMVKPGFVILPAMLAANHVRRHGLPSWLRGRDGRKHEDDGEFKGKGHEPGKDAMDKTAVNHFALPVLGTYLGGTVAGGLLGQHQAPAGHKQEGLRRGLDFGGDTALGAMGGGVLGALGGHELGKSLPESVRPWAGLGGAGLGILGGGTVGHGISRWIQGPASWEPGAEGGHKHKGRGRKKEKEAAARDDDDGPYAGMGSLAMQQYAPIHRRRDLDPGERAEVAEGQGRILPRIFQSGATPIPQMMASPGWSGLGTGLLGGAGGAALGAGLSQGDPLIAGLGGLAGAGLGGLLGYHSRAARNEDLVEAMRRLPAGAVRRDYLADPTVQAELDRSNRLDAARVAGGGYLPKFAGAAPTSMHKRAGGFIPPGVLGGALGAGIGAARAPVGHAGEGAGRGGLAGFGTELGIGGGAGLGLLTGLGLGSAFPESVRPASTAIGAGLGLLGGGIYGGIGGHKLMNMAMGKPTWARRKPGKGRTHEHEHEKEGHYPGCRSSRKVQARQHRKKKRRAFRKHASAELVGELLGVIKRAAAVKCGCGCADCAACGTGTKSARVKVVHGPEVRTGGGQFAWRGRGAKAVTDDPMYDHFGTTKAGALGLMAGRLALGRGA
jgi:hypothetical protein